MAEKYPVTLQKDEKVIKLMRRHPARLVLDIVLTIIVEIIVLVALFWLRSITASWEWLGLLWTILIGIAIVGGLLFIGIEFYRYRNDVWLLTNQRIVDSTRTSPFNQTVSSADLVNVQDMNFHKRGVLATLFNFGDVICQTASQTQHFAFRGVSRPEDVLHLVDTHRDLARHRMYNPEGNEVSG
ncbi:MAG: PH domain-containing protein [Anaerolineae bacterium]|nr:PH domain-containing protein [Anaerolineae bacterium]